MTNLMRGTCALSLALILLALPLAPEARAAPESGWTSSWHSSPTNYSVSFANATVQTRIVLTAGGDRLRLRYSNLYGRSPLKIGAVSVAADGVRKPVTFRGAAHVVIAPGQMVLSDPVALPTQSGAAVTVSTYYPEAIPTDITSGAYNIDRNLLADGRVVDRDVSLASARELPSSYFLTGLDVEGGANRGSIVVVSDSLTGGSARAWPALLAQRLREAGKPYSVINASVGGNRILRDSRLRNYGGESLIKRFQRDVLDQPNLKYVIFFEGSNDLAVARFDGPVRGAMPSAAEMIDGIRTLAGRAHQRGVKFYAATMTSSLGANTPEYGSQQFNAEREKINAWIRSTNEIDGYFDFDRALRDPTNPSRLRDGLHLGDHHHPNDAGQKALSEAIELDVFK